MAPDPTPDTNLALINPNGKLFDWRTIKLRLRNGPQPEGEVVGPNLPPGKYVEVPGRGRLFVRQTVGPPGSPTVILLHGWTVTGDLNWYPTLEPLARRASVVTFDHRGHGSGIPTRRFRMAECAADALAVADALGIEKFICVGYSMGGAIAQLVARSAPHRVTGLVLGATSIRFRGRGWAAVRFAMLPILATVARLAPHRLRCRIFKTVLDRWMGPQLGRWARAEILRGNPLTLLDAGTELFNFDSSKWIADLPMPIAQVRTLGDTVVPDNHQLALTNAVPHISVHAYTGDHDTVVTDPESFWACLSAALDSVETSPDRQKTEASR